MVNKLYPTIDEFECPDYRCKNCKYYKSAFEGGCGRRVDFNKMNYAGPWFNSATEELGYPCSEFVPNGLYLAALPYWHGYEHWREWMNRQNAEDYAETGRIYRAIDDDKALIGFRLKQAPNEFYYVKLKDYINNTMFEGNKFKAVEHHYYKKTKKGFGYDLIKEAINGVIID